MDEYKKKYLEYKIKYIQLKKNMENKNQSGGLWFYHNNPGYTDASFYPVYDDDLSLSLSPIFTTNNNINPPTPREINHYLRNFKHTRRFTPFAMNTINNIRFNYPNIRLILYAFEEFEREEPPHGYDINDPENRLMIELYSVKYYNLHVFYQNTTNGRRDPVIHHKMFSMQIDNQTFYDSRYKDIISYDERSVVNFDYDTLRKFKLPLEHQPTPI